MMPCRKEVRMGQAVKKRKKRVVGKIFFVLGLIVSVSIGSMAATVVHKGNSMLGLINYDNSTKLSSLDMSRYQLDKDTEIVNILLVGADKNADEQNSSKAERRSDSMMIATMDIRNNKLKITSLMRDMYVAIPRRILLEELNSSTRRSHRISVSRWMAMRK